MRLSECWIKYFLVFISIRPWVSLYISVNLDCLLLVSSVAHPVFYHVRNTGEDRAVLHWTLSRALISFFNNGSQAALAYSSFGRTGDVYAIFYILWTIPKGALYCTQRFVCFSCCHGKWAVHLCLLLMVTLRYGKLSTCSNSTPQKTYFLRGGLFLCEMVTILHLEGLNSICLA